MGARENICSQNKRCTDRNDYFRKNSVGNDVRVRTNKSALEFLYDDEIRDIYSALQHDNIIVRLNHNQDSISILLNGGNHKEKVH